MEALGNAQTIINDEKREADRNQRQVKKQNKPVKEESKTRYVNTLNKRYCYYLLCFCQTLVFRRQNKKVFQGLLEKTAYKPFKIPAISKRMR